MVGGKAVKLVATEVGSFLPAELPAVGEKAWGVCAVVDEAHTVVINSNMPVNKIVVGGVKESFLLK